MSGPYTAALVDLRRWRDHVDFLIASLEKLESGAPMVAAAQVPVIPSAPLTERRAPARPSAPGAKDASAKDGDGAQILTVVRKAGGEISPGKLAEALKIDKATLRRRTAPLITSGQLLVNGVTAGRRFTLPAAAKEGL